MNNKGPKKYAILAIHGMGSHQKYASLSDAVSVLMNSRVVQARDKDSIVVIQPYSKDSGTHVTSLSMAVPGENGDSDIHFIRVTPDPAQSTFPQIDVFEAYYSNIPKGRTSLSDIFRFFFSAGWNSLGSQTFKRRVLGEDQNYNSKWFGHLGIVTILTLLFTVIVLNIIFIANFSARAFVSIRFMADADPLPALLTLIIFANLLLIGAWGLVLNAYHKSCFKDAEKRLEEINRSTSVREMSDALINSSFQRAVAKILLYITILIPYFMLTSMIFAAFLMFNDQFSQHVYNWPYTHGIFQLLLGTCRITTIITGMYLISKLAFFNSRRFRAFFHAALTLIVAFSTIIAFDSVIFQNDGANLISWLGNQLVHVFPHKTVWSVILIVQSTGYPIFSSSVMNIDFLVAGLLFITISFLAKFFLLDYLGDVVAYIQGSGPHQTSDQREAMQQQIQTAMQRLIDADYEIIVFAHSLGSIMAYDVLNRMQRSQLLAPGYDDQGLITKPLPVSTLLTYGSPLNKVAYVFKVNDPTEGRLRECLLYFIQPLIQPVTRSHIQWINVYSATDIFAGRLTFYDKSPQNIALTSHGQYIRFSNLAAGTNKNSENQNSEGIVELRDYLNAGTVISHTQYHRFPLITFAIGEALLNLSHFKNDQNAIQTADVKNKSTKSTWFIK